jgi:cardiolipin synthase
VTPLLIAELLAFGLYLAFVVSCGWHLLLARKPPSATVLWAAALVFFPLFGPLAYTAFGVDRLGRRATIKELRNREVRHELEALVPSGPFRELPAEAKPFPGYLDPFAKLVANVSRYRAVGGNSVELLDGGPAFFERALAAIENAESSVLLETFIFDPDDVGQAFLDALARAAERRVRCYLLYDDIGALSLDPLTLDEMRGRGVKIVAFNQRDWLRGRFQINLRNHRKVLVVDGRIGFTGGMNISARHCPRDGERAASEDHHFEVRGPVVAQLTAAFAEDWAYAAGESLTDPELYPEPETAGESVCRVLPSGPDGDAGVFWKVLIGALHAARTRVQLVSPYFLPDEAVSAALCLAAARGVQVDVVVPSKTDHRIVDWAMEAGLGDLLAAGVRVWRRPGPLLHSKLLTIDGHWALVGSPNVDARAFRLNYELALGIADAAVVTTIGEAIQVERARSERQTLQDWTDRGVLATAWSNFWALWNPML